MLTVVAFLVALGLLIAVHEWGHYRVAVACGVKVLRFSVGFGKTLWRWKPKRQRPGQDTEFVIGAFPLGGYVKMLDEREGEVAPSERHRAFNTQSVGKRAAIVAAGPAANLVLAILLYAVVGWIGADEPQAVLSAPPTGSIAERAGVKGGERVLQTTVGGDRSESVESFESLRWTLTQAALDGRDITLSVATRPGSPPRDIVLAISELETREADAQLFRRIGILAPYTRPVLGEVVAGAAAARAGLKAGDEVRAVGGMVVVDGAQLRETIRASVTGNQPRESTWRVVREGRSIDLAVLPDAVREGTTTVGRIGAYVGAPPEMALVRHGPIDGIVRGVAKTWEVSALTLRMIGKMLIGEASLKNLSGPLTIADYAGKSASLGLTQYLVFLALISVSLGVLNLLPLPVLDGGHLVYYFWEAVTGHGVSDAWMERLQRGGVALLLVMMSIALFNDVTRLFG